MTCLFGSLGLAVSQVLHMLQTSGYLPVALCWGLWTSIAQAFANSSVTPGGRKWVMSSGISKDIKSIQKSAMSTYLYLLLSFRIWNYCPCPCFILIDTWSSERCFGCQYSQRSVLKGLRSRIWESKGILQCHFSLGSHCLLWDRNFPCNIGANIIFFMSKDLLIKC